MRKFTCLIVLALTAFTACKKSNNDRGCIDSFNESFNISAADLQAANTLFQNNSISTQDFKITSVSLNNTTTIDGQTSSYDYINVRYYANGLPIFNSDEAFNFKNGQIVLRSGSDFGGVDLGKTPSLRLNDVRGLFVSTYNANYDAAAVHVADSCLRAEFGYYSINPNVNSTTANLQPAHNVVKAWKVQFQNSRFPILYFRDDNSALITTDDGIVPFYNTANPKHQ